LFQLLGVGSLVVFLFIPYLAQVWKNKVSLVWLKKLLTFLSSIGWRNQLIATLWSLLRFFVFVAQFILLCFAFGVDVPFLLLFQGIIAILFIQTIIPTNGLAELGVRGLAITHIFGHLSPSTFVLITLATYLLWTINVLLPASVGALLITFNKSVE
jgi:hypothetical protein